MRHRVAWRAAKDGDRAALAAHFVQCLLWRIDHRGHGAAAGEDQTFPTAQQAIKIATGNLFDRCTTGWVAGQHDDDRASVSPGGDLAEQNLLKSMTIDGLGDPRINDSHLGVRGDDAAEQQQDGDDAAQKSTVVLRAKRW